MPEKTQSLPVNGYDASKIQALALGTFNHLGWTVKYSNDGIVLGYTPQKWNRYANEITVETTDNELKVTSKMVHGEAFDMMGRTKKDVATFLSAFEAVRSKASPAQINEWSESIASLNLETIKAAEQEVKEAAAIDNVMNLSAGNKNLTYGIIALNVLVFLAMAVSGVSIITPTTIDIINWGGNFGPLTLSGDWWRLVSCVFVHIGIVHLLFNMYALFMVGMYLEPMLGKPRYIAAYLITGVFASVASLWWHKDPVASAGASGAIFGMYGVFLALLSTNLIPKQIRNSLLQSIGVFVVYNLVYGLKSGVDNAAHIGGLVSGLVIGYLYFPGLKQKSKKPQMIIGIVAALGLAVAVFYLQGNTVTKDTRSKTMSEVSDYKYQDAGKFNDKYNAIIAMQEVALGPLRDTGLTNEQLMDQLNSISLPEWEKASVLAEQLKNLNVSDNAKKKAGAMSEYIDLRKEHIRVIIAYIKQPGEATSTELNEVNNKINEIIKVLDNL